MLKTYRKQHRPSRDPLKSKEILELRQENRKLKQQIRQLRKEISQLEIEIAEFSSENTEDNVSQPTNNFNKKLSCDNCGSDNISSYVTPSGKTISGCKDCKKMHHQVSS